jgi:hypothetical protein
MINLKKNYALILALGLMLTGCTGQTGTDETKATQTQGMTTSGTEETVEPSPSADNTTVDVQTTENKTEEDTTAVKDTTDQETESEEESTAEETTAEEPTTEETEEPTAEEETTPETTAEPTTAEPTTPEPTTAEPTTPEPTTPEPTTPEPTTPAPTTPAPTEPTTAEPATTQPIVIVKAVKIEGSVSGTHYIGDTLSGADFTIKVTMSDGNVLTNPAGWAAAPLQLSAASNVITIAYADVSTQITVNASEKPATQPTQPQNPTASDNLGTAYHPDEMVEYIAHNFFDDTTNSAYGKPYVCSTFVQAVFAHFGMSIPSDLNALYNLDKTSPNVTEVPWSEAKAGDILVYAGQMPIYNSKGEITGYASGHCGIFYKWDNWKGIAALDLGGDHMMVGISHFDKKYKVLRFSGNTYAQTGTHTDRFGVSCAHIEGHTNLVMIAATLGWDFITKTTWEDPTYVEMYKNDASLSGDWYYFNW